MLNGLITTSIVPVLEIFLTKPQASFSHILAYMQEYVQILEVWFSSLASLGFKKFG